MVLFHTHLLLGITAFLLVKDYFSGGNEIVFLCLLLLGSILPDIDEQGSKINRWLGLPGSIIAFFSKHRGFFHSLPFFCLSSFAVYYFLNWNYAAALFLGYIAHLFGDGISKRGVTPFYPFSLFKIKGLLKVGGFVEWIMGLVLMVLIIIKLL